MSSDNDNNAIAARNRAKQQLWLLQEERRRLVESSEVETSSNLPEAATCPICYEEFNSQERVPMTLFPCGHTLCSSCLRMVESSSETRKCSVCSTLYNKTSRNITLMKVLDSGKSLFSHKTVASLDVETTKSRLEIYIAQLNSAKTRHERISHELKKNDDELFEVNAEIEFIESEKEKISGKVADLKKSKTILESEGNSLKEAITRYSTELEKLALLVEATGMTIPG